MLLCFLSIQLKKTSESISIMDGSIPIQYSFTPIKRFKDSVKSCSIMLIWWMLFKLIIYLINSTKIFGQENLYFFFLDFFKISASGGTPKMWCTRSWKHWKDSNDLITAPNHIFSLNTVAHLISKKFSSILSVSRIFS